MKMHIVDNEWKGKFFLLISNASMNDSNTTTFHCLALHLLSKLCLKPNRKKKLHLGAESLVQEYGHFEMAWPFHSNEVARFFEIHRTLCKVYMETQFHFILTTASLGTRLYRYSQK